MALVQIVLYGVLGPWIILDLRDSHVKQLYADFDNTGGAVSSLAFGRPFQSLNYVDNPVDDRGLQQNIVPI